MSIDVPNLLRAQWQDSSAAMGPAIGLESHWRTDKGVYYAAQRGIVAWRHIVARYGFIDDAIKRQLPNFDDFPLSVF